MSNPRIIEGTGKEIGAALLSEPFASLWLRVTIDQEIEEDLAADIAPPSFTVRDEAHLKELLLKSVNRPTQPVTEETWNSLHRRIEARAAQRGT